MASEPMSYDERAAMMGMTRCQRCKTLAVQWMGNQGLCGRCDKEHDRIALCGCHYDGEGDLIPCGEHA